MSTHAVKRIVCLANSRMSGGRCIAGKVLQTDGRAGEWIRPVTAWTTGALSERERQYGDGGEPRALDVIDVPVVEAKPTEHQQENWVVNPERRWVRVGRMDGSALPYWLDVPPTLWVNGYSSDDGVNDRVPSSETGTLESSLSLICVDALRVNVSESDGDQAPELRGSFEYNGHDYSLRITDADAESGSMRMRPGDYDSGARFLTISLTAKPFEGYLYKLIAAIVRPGPGAR